MKTAKLLWVDLEMTGLDPEQDKILEIAAITTGWDLKPLNTFEAVVNVDENIIKSRMVGDFWEKNKESYNSLVAQNQSGKPIQDVEQDLLAFLDKNFKKDYVIILAGNSIHQDR
ncbi:3'-5' exoribonuclease, partial [Candidatus Saccharibacteria bacterium]|nr:3'-5' exoribonuclease [Candidatus Saccharibacteria bacterium]